MKQPRKLIIDPEFRRFIPPLRQEEYAQLEVNILRAGRCIDPLIAWAQTDILLDGHHRYDIATLHHLPYEVVYHDFDDRQQALEWMLRHQLGRRNLSDYARIVIAMSLKADEFRKGKQNQQGGVSLNSEKRVDSGALVARVAAVSRDTVYRVQYIEQHASEEQRLQLRAGDTSINEVYKSLRKQLQPKPPPTVPPMLQQPIAGARTGLQIKTDDGLVIATLSNATEAQCDQIVRFLETLLGPAPDFQPIQR